MKKTSYRAAAELLAECVSEWAFYWLKAFFKHRHELEWSGNPIYDYPDAKISQIKTKTCLIPAFQVEGFTYLIKNKGDLNMFPLTILKELTEESIIHYYSLYLPAPQTKVSHLKKPRAERSQWMASRDIWIRCL